MIELLEDRSTLIDTEPGDKKVLPGKVMKLLSAGRSKRKEVIKNGGSELKIAHSEITNPATWIMPPQPEAYIKYPRYDFL